MYMYVDVCQCIYVYVCVYMCILRLGGVSIYRQCRVTGVQWWILQIFSHVSGIAYAMCHRMLQYIAVWCCGIERTG